MTNTLIAQLNNPAVLQRYNQRLATAVSLMLIVACAYVLVQITWMFFPPEESMLPVNKPTASLVSNSSAQNNFDNLTAANIFGVSDRAVVNKQAKIQETKLNLTLKGVLAAIPMDRASAIIAKGKSGKEDIYGVGDKMPGGVLVKEIYADHVVLERGGKLEILKLQKVSGISNLNAASGSSLSSSRGYGNKTPASALKEIRTNILKNPTSFGDYALPVMVKENGKQIGYRLQPQQQGSLLVDVGLQPTDVITQINGIRLDKPQNGISALRKLSTAKNLSITVKRNGAEVPINISLQ